MGERITEEQYSRLVDKTVYKIPILIEFRDALKAEREEVAELEAENAELRKAHNTPYGAYLGIRDKRNALVDRLNLLTAQVQEMADDEWPDDAKINSGWLLDELALLNKEKNDDD